MGLIGALTYLSYPAGVSEAEGYSYRIVQTVLYHGLMLAQGVFAIAFKDLELGKKTLKYDCIAVLCLVVWAFLGNNLYSGVLTEVCECVEGCTHVINVYEHDFNWFFVKHDALYVISDEIDIYFAPFVMLGIIFALSAFIRFVGLKIHTRNQFRAFARSIRLRHNSWHHTLIPKSLFNSNQVLNQLFISLYFTNDKLFAHDKCCHVPAIKS